jgi:predicted Ser/Thr protein kinase
MAPASKESQRLQRTPAGGGCGSNAAALDKDAIVTSEEPFSRLTRETLNEHLCREIRPGSGSRPALLLVEDRGARAVVKDYRHSGWLLRGALGPWLIAREAQVYRRLAGCAGVPRLICRLDRWALLVEHIEGRSCAEYAAGELPAEFFDRLREVVEGMHARGVVHCDIKNRGNIVVGPGGQPYLLDFAAAFTRGSALNPVRRALFERFRLDDLRGVTKAKLLVGRLWNQPDADFAFKRGPFERAVRAVRDSARRAFKLLVRG